MVGKVALGSLRHAFAAPADEHMLGECAVRVFDFDECKLHLAVGEFIDEIDQFALS